MWTLAHTYIHLHTTTYVFTDVCAYVCTYVCLHIPRTCFNITVTPPPIRNLLANYTKNYCTIRNLLCIYWQPTNYIIYMPPIGLEPYTLFHFLFCYHSLQNRFLHYFFVWHLGTITYSLLFMFDGIFTLNGCNLTHKETKIWFIGE